MSQEDQNLASVLQNARQLSNACEDLLNPLVRSNAMFPSDIADDQGLQPQCIYQEACAAMSMLQIANDTSSYLRNNEQPVLLPKPDVVVIEKEVRSSNATSIALFFLTVLSVALFLAGSRVPRHFAYF